MAVLGWKGVDLGCPECCCVGDLVPASCCGRISVILALEFDALYTSPAGLQRSKTGVKVCAWAARLGKLALKKASSKMRLRGTFQDARRQVKAVLLTTPNQKMTIGQGGQIWISESPLLPTTSVRHPGFFLSPSLYLGTTWQGYDSQILYGKKSCDDKH
jgi:hypothetical protein